MKKIFLTAALCGFGAFDAYGAAVTVQADDDNGFSAAIAGNLAPTNLVRVGTFDIPDAVISQNSTDKAFLNLHFTPLETAASNARIGENTGNPQKAGHLDKTVSNPNSDSLLLANKQIYLWVLNSTDNSSLDSSFNTAVEHGVFYLDMATPSAENLAAANWRFRDHDEIPNNSTIDISDLTDAAGTTLATGARVVIGLFPYGTSTSTGAPNFGLVQIPEPSAAALGCAALIGLANRRRRVG